MKLFAKTFLALVLSGFVAYAQEPASKDKAAASLSSMLDSYKAVIQSGDSAKALEYVYPGVFKAMPKAQQLELIKQQEASGAPKPKIINIKQTPVMPLKEYSKGLYALVNYEMDMQMSLAQPGKEKEMEKMLKDPKELASFQKMMKGMLLATLGSNGTVEFEPNSFIAKMNQKSNLIAIDEEGKGWKIVEFSAPTAPMLEIILPKEIFSTYKTQIDTLKAEAEAKLNELMKAMSGDAPK